MDSTGGFPIDLVLFGMIAAFLVLRLRSVLGKRQGFERPNVPVQPAATVAPRSMPQGQVIEATAEALPKRAVPEPTSEAGQVLARMQQIDPQFQPSRFLEGAETAFRMIVTAFAAGNREALRPLLSPDTFAAFDSAISGRETARETQKTEIRSIPTIAIDHANIAGTVADITVRFVSDQVNVTLGENGLPVAGADAVMEITDLWTFERDLVAHDPTWRLVAARSA
jgi:predicted lipid-binding transport protein (Tim44 family)